MAAAEQNSDIFVNGDGTPMKFYLPPGALKIRLKTLITQGGGILTSKRETGVIRSNYYIECRLCPLGSPVHEDGSVSVKFIEKSVAQNTLLDIEEFRLSEGDVASDDSLIEESDRVSANIIRASARERRGRSKYLQSEDMRIIKYILDENCQDRYKGNAIWKQMAIIGITPHSWQSMKHRYSEIILKDIHSYRVTPAQIEQLTGKPVSSPLSRKARQIKETEKLNISDFSDFSPDEIQNIHSAEEASTTELETEEEGLDEFDQELLKAASSFKGCRKFPRVSLGERITGAEKIVVTAEINHTSAEDTEESTTEKDRQSSPQKSISKLENSHNVEGKSPRRSKRLLDVSDEKKDSDHTSETMNPRKRRSDDEASTEPDGKRRKVPLELKSSPLKGKPLSSTPKSLRRSARVTDSPNHQNAGHESTPLKKERARNDQSSPDREIQTQRLREYVMDDDSDSDSQMPSNEDEMSSEIEEKMNLIKEVIEALELSPAIVFFFLNQAKGDIRKAVRNILNFR